MVKTRTCGLTVKSDSRTYAYGLGQNEGDNGQSVVKSGRIEHGHRPK